VIKNGDVVKYKTERTVFGVVVIEGIRMHVRYFYNGLSPSHATIFYSDILKLESVWEKV